MRSTRIILTSAALVAAAACSSTTVHTDYDREADFTGYSTYAWRSNEQVERGPTAGTSGIVDGRIRRAVSENLAAKGLEAVPAESADLLVTYYASLSSQLRMHTTYWGYGWSPHWPYSYGFWPGWGATTIQPYHEGTIIVDIVDRRLNQLVWRGTISRALTRSSSSEARINEAMNRVLEGFPPA